ncbi:hypothetical protein [Oleisolibacter albus]|uniref:hypothetical protein n=1 Tax=Oleisolibacter albus TaxID=2171757 RepID=UPI0012D7924E|nr:hypothetical protein [Oleisolibacter albus]
MASERNTVMVEPVAETKSPERRAWCAPIVRAIDISETAADTSSPGPDSGFNS